MSSDQHPSGRLDIEASNLSLATLTLLHATTMSEYWKSTPSYWCKFCTTYVRDTKQSRASHEATPRHQNSVQRSLRTLHKDQDRAARESQRAKDEVARLNGLVSGAPKAGAAQAPRVTVSGTGDRPADMAERKRQAAQLAALGVAVPEAMAKELGVVGEWQSVRPSQEKKRLEAAGPVLNRRIKNEDEEEEKPATGGGTGISFGVRKRERPEDEAEDEEGGVQEKSQPKGWGQRVRTYPGSNAQVGAEDVAALLAGGGGGGSRTGADVAGDDVDKTIIKKEDDEAHGEVVDAQNDTKDAVAGRAVIASEAAPPVFKKRKAKVSKG